MIRFRKTTTSALMVLFAAVGPVIAIANAPPPPPVQICAVPGPNRVALTWRDAPTADRYTIYWSNTPGLGSSAPNKLSLVGLEHVFENLPNDQPIYFVVTATNDKGESGLSTEVMATPNAAGHNPHPRPGAPVGLSAWGIPSAIQVSWNPVAGANRYTVLWNVGGTFEANDSSTGRDAGAVSPHTFNTWNPTTPHFARVLAANPSCEGPASVAVSATPGAPTAPPGAPTGLRAMAGSGRITLSWLPPNNARAFNIYWSENAGVTTGSINKRLGVANPATVTGLVDETRYYFVVTAVNDAGEGPASAEISAVPTNRGADPPTGIHAIAGNTKISVFWDASPNADAYNLYYRPSEPGVTKASGTKMADVQSGVDISNLSNGTCYYVVVTGLNGSAEGSESSEVCATPYAP